MDSLMGGGRGVGGWIRYKAIAYYYLSGYCLRIRPRRDLRRSPRRLRFLPGILDALAPPAGRAPLARRRAEGSHVADADSRESGAMPGGVRVIENDGNNAELELEVGRVVDRLRRGRDGWRRWHLWGLPPVAGIVAAAVVCTNLWRRESGLRRSNKSGRSYET